MMSDLNSNESDLRNRGTELMLIKKGEKNSEALKKKFSFRQTLTFFEKEFVFQIEFFSRTIPNS
jgi:hypothetical protein